MTDTLFPELEVPPEHINLKGFFTEIDSREDDISEIRTEINACFDSYCSSTGTDKEALKLAYKLYKALNKDRPKAEAMQFEYDKMAELLITQKEQMDLFKSNRPLKPAILPMKPDKVEGPSPFGKFIFHGHPHCIYMKTGNLCAAPLCGHIPIVKEIPETVAIADPADEQPANVAEEAAIAKKNRERQIDKNRKCCYPADRDIRIDGSIRTMYCRVCGLIAKKEDYSDLGNIKPVSFIVGERVELGQVAA